MDITASGLSVLREIDALAKLHTRFVSTNRTLNSTANRAFHDEVLVLGDAVVNSKRTLVTNDDSSPGQHELGQFVDRHAKEFNAENTTPERKKEIMQVSTPIRVFVRSYCSHQVKLIIISCSINTECVLIV